MGHTSYLSFPHRSSSRVNVAAPGACVRPGAVGRLNKGRKWRPGRHGSCRSLIWGHPEAVVLVRSDRFSFICPCGREYVLFRRCVSAIAGPSRNAYTCCNRPICRRSDSATIAAPANRATYHENVAFLTSAHECSRVLAAKLRDPDRANPCQIRTGNSLCAQKGVAGLFGIGTRPACRRLNSTSFATGRGNGWVLDIVGSVCLVGSWLGAPQGCYG